jgi:hypothetical protein
MAEWGDGHRRYVSCVGEGLSNRRPECSDSLGQDIPLYVPHRDRDSVTHVAEDGHLRSTQKTTATARVTWSSVDLVGRR